MSCTIRTFTELLKRVQPGLLLCEMLATIRTLTDLLRRIRPGDSCVSCTIRTLPELLRRARPGLVLCELLGELLPDAEQIAQYCQVERNAVASSLERVSHKRTEHQRGCERVTLPWTWLLSIKANCGASFGRPVPHSTTLLGVFGRKK